MNRREFISLLKSVTVSPFFRFPAQSLITPIQEWIDDAVATEKTFLRIPPGTYPISQPIECAYNVSLDLTGCVLQAVEDVDIFHAAHRASITGALIDCSQVTYTHAAIVLDGASRFDDTFPTRFANIDILGNWQTGGESGTGILMQAGEGFIQGVTLANIGCSYLHDGLRMTASGGAWCNGNHAINLNYKICRRAITLDHADGNTITNVQVQPDANAIRALICGGNFNMISNFVAWDWASETAIEVTGHYNRITTDLFTSKITDNGWHNQIGANEP